MGLTLGQLPVYPPHPPPPYVCRGSKSWNTLRMGCSSIIETYLYDLCKQLQLSTLGSKSNILERFCKILASVSRVKSRARRKSLKHAACDTPMSPRGTCHLLAPYWGCLVAALAHQAPTHGTALGQTRKNFGKRVSNIHPTGYITHPVDLYICIHVYIN